MDELLLQGLTDLIDVQKGLLGVLRPSLPFGKEIFVKFKETGWTKGWLFFFATPCLPLSVELSQQVKRLLLLCVSCDQV